MRERELVCEIADLLEGCYLAWGKVLHLDLHFVKNSVQTTAFLENRRIPFEGEVDEEMIKRVYTDGYNLFFHRQGKPLFMVADCIEKGDIFYRIELAN
jgi:hypothetical protein